MARVFTDSNGVTLIIPDSSVSVQVKTQPLGLATTGVIALVGEAEEGPHWSEEEKLSDNSFGPGDIQRVIAKYGSGRLVEGFRGLIGASASPLIQGSFNRAILVKTNQGSKAALNTDDGHGKFIALNAGIKGNQIKTIISSEVEESAPTTGFFSYIPNSSAASLALRVNGEAEQTLTIAADTSPAVLATNLVNLSNINVIGGNNRNITFGLTASNLIELSVVSGQNVKIKLTAPAVWGNSPQVGDTIRIPSGSVIDGGSANIGWYLVTAVTNTASLAEISAKKITPGAPVNVSAVNFSSTPANDIVGYAYMRIDNMSGKNRNVLTGLVGQNASITVSGSSITFTLSTPNIFNASPKVGDIVYIPSGSPFAGSGSANVGWYKITQASNFATNAYITAARLSNGLPVAVSSTAIAAVTDLQVFRPDIDGAGKALEIYDNGGAVNIDQLFKQLGQDVDASWINTLLVSSAERKARFDIVRSSPLREESFVHGGNIVLEIGYQGTTATASIVLSGGKKRLQTNVTGGAGSNLDILLEDYNSIDDLVAYINNQAGYSAAAHNPQEGQRSPELVLDRVTNIGICSSASNRKPGRIKRDIYDITKGIANMAQNSTLIEYQVFVGAGLPEAQPAKFLSGGARGGTTGLAFAEAIDALSNVRCNFVVPLVSQDAAQDKLEGLTDASSTYTISAVNAAVKTHVINMSTAKTKRHRIALVSRKGTFAEAKAAAQQMSSFRVACLFQDVKDVNIQGEIETFQPWMAAVKAAGMQAAGFYRSIFNKAVNISGVIDPPGFNNQNVSLGEDALLAGLMPLSQLETGEIIFLSDQLTYGTDNNFVYNSLQAVYGADIIALTMAESLKKAFIGASVADVDASVVINFIKAKMEELRDKRLIVGTADYPAGWKSIDVAINQGVIEVRCVVIEATSIYFIPINIDIEGFTSTATA